MVGAPRICSRFALPTELALADGSPSVTSERQLTRRQSLTLFLTNGCTSCSRVAANVPYEYFLRTSEKPASVHKRYFADQHSISQHMYLLTNDINNVL